MPCFRRLVKQLVQNLSVEYTYYCKLRFHDKFLPHFYFTFLRSKYIFEFLISSLSLRSQTIIKPVTSSVSLAESTQHVEISENPSKVLLRAPST